MQKLGLHNHMSRLRYCIPRGPLEARPEIYLRSHSQAFQV